VARAILDQIVQDTPVVRVDTRVGEAHAHLIDRDLPALPVTDGDGRLAGIFGEREFLEALFPGYLKELKSAFFVPQDLNEALQERFVCAGEPVGDHMNTEHVDVGTDASDLQVAEIFLHHRVLIVPVTEDGRVRGVVRRSAFFKALARRLLDAAPG
jgi:CBS domain-containing protein